MSPSLGALAGQRVFLAGLHVVFDVVDEHLALGVEKPLHEAGEDAVSELAEVDGGAVDLHGLEHEVVGHGRGGRELALQVGALSNLGYRFEEHLGGDEALVGAVGIVEELTYFLPDLVEAMRALLVLHALGDEVDLEEHELTEGQA